VCFFEYLENRSRGLDVTWQETLLCDREQSVFIAVIKSCSYVSTLQITSDRSSSSSSNLRILGIASLVSMATAPNYKWQEGVGGDVCCVSASCVSQLSLKAL
jgi:hypothetical protein